MSVDDKACTWDNVTGALIAQTQMDIGIARFLVAIDGGYAFLAGSNGTIDIVDMTEGFRYSAFEIQTSSNLRDVSVKNSVLAVRAYASPDLKIFKYHKNSGMTEPEKYINGIKSIQISPAEVYYAVNAYDSALKVFAFFDHALLSTWINGEEKSVQDCAFVDDKPYVIVCSDGSM